MRQFLHNIAINVPHVLEKFIHVIREINEFSFVFLMLCTHRYFGYSVFCLYLTIELLSWERLFSCSSRFNNKTSIFSPYEKGLAGVINILTQTLFIYELIQSNQYSEEFSHQHFLCQRNMKDLCFSRGFNNNIIVKFFTLYFKLQLHIVLE